MDKQKQVKKQIRIEINNLLDYKCGPCSSAACSTCNVQARINELGERLDTPEKTPNVEVVEMKRPKKPIRHSDKKYFKLFDAGLSNSEVEKELNVSDRTVVSKRQKWKKARGIETYTVNNRKNRNDIRHAMYVKEFEEGHSYVRVSKFLNVSLAAAYRHKKRWEREKQENV